jgi:hypothetical protein
LRARHEARHLNAFSIGRTVNGAVLVCAQPCCERALPNEKAAARNKRGWNEVPDE